MHFLLCDDDSIFLQQLSAQLTSIMEEFGQPITITSCTTQETLWDALQKKSCDALFLDIDMPDATGFQIAQKLLESDASLRLIFVSSHSELVFDAFHYTPFWFIPKQDTTMLRKVIARLLELLQKEFYLFTCDSKEKRLLIREIVYFEADKHYIKLHHSSGEMWRYKASIRHIEAQLQAMYFVRCHAGYVVNCRYIEQINKYDLLLYTGQTIPVSRQRRQATQLAKLLYFRSQAL